MSHKKNGTGAAATRGARAQQDTGEDNTVVTEIEDDNNKIVKKKGNWNFKFMLKPFWYLIW